MCYIEVEPMICNLILRTKNFKYLKIETLRIVSIIVISIKDCKSVTFDLLNLKDYKKFQCDFFNWNSVLHDIY